MRLMESTLFNDATIKRLIADTKPTPKQKKAVSKWLSYLKDKKLENEKQAYIEFARVILKDLLDYDISLDGLKHEEGNMEFPFRDSSGNYLVVFEAKGTKTKNLWAYQGRVEKSKETPVNQINYYLYDKKIPFGVLTNYNTFVLFDRNEGSKKYHSIDFTELINENKLKEFVALFSREQVEKGFIAKVIKESIIEEREFTKEFYKLYHETRLMLIKEFEENTDINKDASVHFAQIFLNRLMFVLFAEDTGKIDKRVVEDRILKTLDSVHLFSSNSNNISNVLVGLFKDLDKGSDFPTKLFGFNGGLFKHPIPERIHFKDFRDNKFFKNENKASKLKKKDLKLNEEDKEIFEKYKNKINPIIRNILLMASFDFNSEVNVNILGHIFEQSISDIEDLKTDKSSRRKKEGIFYTPEYITDYICRNTIIPYLSKKGVNVVSDLIEEYSDNIEELEKKFKSMKILDPACGSGAFLIKATDIMLEIFKTIQEFKQWKGEYNVFKLGKSKLGKGRLGPKPEGKQLSLNKWNEEDEAREIIEDSIYGVDINEESVEITKLALFLKMARKNRKLTDLSDNIKRGNSLIDDKEVAGDLAFDWDEKFPFKFDVVVGNPPYVDVRKIAKEEKKFLFDKFKTAKNRTNTFALFSELGINLLKDGGDVGFIIPNTLLTHSSYEELRKSLIEKGNLLKIVDLDSGVFEDATVDTIMFIFNKSSLKDNKLELLRRDKKTNKFTSKIIENDFKDNDNYKFLLHIDKFSKSLLEKIKNDVDGLGEFYHGFNGINPGNQRNRVVIKEKLNEKYKKVIDGKNISRYNISWKGDWVLYDKKILARARNEKIFLEKPKIMMQKIGTRLVCSLDEQQLYALINTTILLKQKEGYDQKFIISILNSKLLNYYYKKKFLGVQIKTEFLENLPIKKISPEEQKPFIEKADLMLKLNKEFYEEKNKFLTMLKSDFGLEKVSKKLENFHQLDWSGFEEELGKKKVSLSGSKKDDWFDRFSRMSKDVASLKDKIDKTDDEIDNMVYDLYGLSDNEVKVVEGV